MSAQLIKDNIVFISYLSPSLNAIRSEIYTINIESFDIIKNQYRDFSVPNGIRCLSIGVINENSVLIAYGENSSNYLLYGIVASIDSNLSITYGTSIQLSSVSNSGVHIPSILNFKNNIMLIIHSYSYASRMSILYCIIDNLNITIGTDNNVSSQSISNEDFSLALNKDKTKGVAIYPYNTSYYYLYAAPVTFSETSASQGTSVLVNSSNYAAGKMGIVRVSERYFFGIH